MKKVLTAILFALILMSLYSCTNETNQNAIKQNNENSENITFTQEDYKLYGKSTYYHKLTLDDVSRLSEKGDELSWDAFANFKYIETGSGLYIRLYEINDDYSLSIGGAGPESAPMYIYLTYLKAPYERIDIRQNSVRDFIERTSNIKNGTRRFTALVVQNGEVTLPAGKSENGMTIDNDKLVLSVMDCGNTEFESDNLITIIKSDLTGKTALPRLLKGDIVRGELDENSEIVPFTETPYRIVKAVSVDRCREGGEIIKPLESLPENYGKEDAKADKCVYFEDFDILFGEEYFDSFLANVKYKSPANIRLVYRFAESDITFANDLYFNGTDFTIREMENGNEILQTYKYLRPFITDITDTSARLRYTLTNDPDVTYERLFKGVLSSRHGDYIPFRDVYFQAGFVKDGEFYDDSMIASDNPKPKKLITQ